MPPVVAGTASARSRASASAPDVLGDHQAGAARRAARQERLLSRVSSGSIEGGEPRELESANGTSASLAVSSASAADAAWKPPWWKTASPATSGFSLAAPSSMTSTVVQRRQRVVERAADLRQRAQAERVLEPRGLAARRA